MRLAAFLVVLLFLPAAWGIPAEDDAGSGKDAPGTAIDDVRVLPGIVYEGNLSGGPADRSDVYSFLATNGETIHALAWFPTGCVELLRPDATLRGVSCRVAGRNEVRVTADTTGVWFLSVRALTQEPSNYRFAFELDGDAPAPEPHPALRPSGTWIQPGAPVSTPGGSCTLNFVYDGTGSHAGDVFVGTAAHCFTALNQRASTPPFGSFGTVVYMGDYDGINTGSFSNGIPGDQVDFALIRIDAAFHASARGEVRGHPGLPSGGVLSWNQAVLGDRLDFSGYGTGFSLTGPTREMRSGVLTFRSTAEWNAVAPIMPGDSGGPVLHESGKAFGVATHVSAGGAGGPFVEQALAEAAAAGWTVVLRNA